MDCSGLAAWWAYQSVLGLLRGLSHRQALLHRPFPMAICLCPVSFPFLAPSFFPFISASPSSSIPHFGLSVLFDLFPLSLFWLSGFYHHHSSPVFFSLPPGKHSVFPLAVERSNIHLLLALFNYFLFLSLFITQTALLNTWLWLFN